MARYRTFQTTFTAGEFDQKLRDRTDIRPFFEGAQLMRNYALLSQGGFTRRPGSFLLNSIAEGRIIPFEYSARDALIINLHDMALTVYDLSGFIIAQDIPTSIPLSEVFNVKYVQRGNGLILAHQDYPPSLLERNPLSDVFTFEPIRFAEDSDGVSKQPFIRKNQNNDTKFTVSTLAVGAATITCTQDYFTPDHVNTYFKIEKGYFYITSYTGPQSVSGNQIIPPYRTTIADPLEAINGDTGLRVVLTEHNFTVGQTIELRNFLPFAGLSSANINGTRTVTSVINANTFTVTAGAAPNDNDFGGGSLGEIVFTGPTSVVREQAFSPVNGYPGAVCIHEERLWFGGTPGVPDTLYGSVTAEFDNYDVNEGLPSDSIQVNIESGSVNEIRHLVSSRHLQIMTNDNEFFAPSTDQSPLTPESFVVRKQTPYGSSQVRASLFDGATIFAQESGRSVREFLYTDREFAYNAKNIALLAQHLIEEPKDLQTVYGGLTRPEQYAFFLNSTGTLAVLHSIRSEDIVGWTQWATDGTYEGIVVVGQRVFITRRSTQTGTLTLEEFDFEFNYFMDGLIGFATESGTTNTWGPAPEYANLEVAVTSGPYFLGYVTVGADGYFQTDGEYESVEIGENYIAQARTMQSAFSLPDGHMTGLPLRLTRAVVDFGESNIIEVEDQRLVIRVTEDEYPQNWPGTFDDKREFWLNIISRNPYIDFVSDIPLSATIYSVLIEIAF